MNGWLLEPEYKSMLTNFRLLLQQCKQKRLKAACTYDENVAFDVSFLLLL
jgi:hypothetical protein